LVLEYGFAYGHEGTACVAKVALTVTTGGGSRQAYCRRDTTASLSENCWHLSKRLTSAGWYLPPFVVQGTHQLRTTSNCQTQDYHTIITALRDNTVNWEPQINSTTDQSLDQVIRTRRYHTMHNRGFFFQAFPAGGGAVGVYAKRLGLGSVLGYLVAGVVIGPLC